jgi:hypothetical protein
LTSVPATLIPAVNPTAAFYPVQIDVLFLVDSVAGITELENGISNLSRAINSLPGAPDVRLGLVTMDDSGLHTIAFTQDVGLLLAALQEVEVAGTDPVIWSMMLDEAVTGVEWRTGATVKLIIGLAASRPDADYTLPLQATDAQGIVLDVITLGEVDEQTESIYREMTRLTSGQYVRLSGSGYTLHEWIVQLIAQELAASQSG